MTDIYELALLGVRRVRLQEWEADKYIEIREVEGTSHLIVDSHALLHEGSKEPQEVRLYDFVLDGWEAAENDSSSTSTTSEA